MKIRDLEKIFEDAHSYHIQYNGVCNDCGRNVTVSIDMADDGEITIKGGALYNPEFGTPPTEHIILKCIECFKKDKTLRNWNPCEVWSRVVGYLRPVQDYNLGKREEFKHRKEFVIG